MSLWKSLLALLPVTLISALFLLRKADATFLGMGYLISFAFVNYLFFMMLRTGKTWKYRAMMFISTAVLFPIFFIHHNIMERGSMLISPTQLYECKVPFCHLVIPVILIPAAVLKEIPFAGLITSVAATLVLLISVMIVLGRGWCSWGCFFGGWDEGVAQLKKKASFKFISPRWKLLPYAVFFATALITAYMSSSAYCQWLCPFKPMTEFRMITTTKELLSTIVSFSMFFLFIVILPFLSKKRAQCSYFCPLGPTLVALSNRVNIFGVKVDTDKCVNCKKCIAVCELNAIDEASLKTGFNTPECSKCGKCIDVCPKQALSFYVHGTGCTANPETARLLFLYASFILMVAVLGNLFARGAGTILVLLFA